MKHLEVTDQVFHLTLESLHSHEASLRDFQRGREQPVVHQHGDISWEQAPMQETECPRTMQHAAYPLEGVSAQVRFVRRHNRHAAHTA